LKTNKTTLVGDFAQQLPIETADAISIGNANPQLIPHASADAPA
jgi:hypothetical protein